MKILNSLILFLLLQVFAFGQCEPCRLPIFRKV